MARQAALGDAGGTPGEGTRSVLEVLVELPDLSLPSAAGVSPDRETRLSAGYQSSSRR